DWARSRTLRCRKFLPTVVARAIDCEGGTSDDHADERNEIGQRCHHRVPFFSGSGAGSGGPVGGSVGSPNSSDSFFWTSIMISALRSSVCSFSTCLRRRSFSSPTGSRVDLRPRFFGASAAFPARSCSVSHRETV